MRINLPRSGTARGFALVAALFLLVVLGALGAFAMRINMTQQQGSDSTLSRARARAAAQAGMQYAAARLLATGDCATLTPSFNVAYGMSVGVTCSGPLAPAPLVNGVPVRIFTVTATASAGVYGSADFVAQSVSGRIAP